MPSAPQFVLVMRHAEKLADPLDPNLSPAGSIRAQKLVTYVPQEFGNPDFIFAKAISKHSARPYQTVQPLSEAINVAIDATFADQDYGALASTILSSAQYANKKVLVCWHHGNIPPLMQALGCTGGYPDPWDPAVFNLILNVTFEGGEPAVTQVSEPF
jgi:phosphohistidine phosphatase SixA